MIGVSPIPLIIVTVGVLIAAATDIWKFRIYNALTLPLLLTGLLYHGVVNGLAGLGDSVLGILFGFCILLLLYVMGGMGAGDVKLMAAVGAWLGMPLTFYVFVASSLAAGVYALVLMVLSQGFADTAINFYIILLKLKSFGRHLGFDSRIEEEVKRDDRRRRLIPFAAMVAVGLAATYIWLHNGKLPIR